MTNDAEIRRYAAILIRRHFDGTVTPEVLISNFQDSSDPLIRFAMNLVAHQPRRGFFGVREQHWRNVYWPCVEQVLHELEKGGDGKSPGTCLYPVVTPLRLVGYFLLGTYVLAAGARHAIKVWRHLQGLERVSDWQLLVSLAISAVLAACAVSIFRAFAYRVRLYRQRDQTDPSTVV